MIPKFASQSVPQTLANFGIGATSAVNLKFLSFGVASSYGNTKFKNRTRIIKLLVPL